MISLTFQPTSYFREPIIISKPNNDENALALNRMKKVFRKIDEHVADYWLAVENGDEDMQLQQLYESFMSFNKFRDYLRKSTSPDIFQWYGLQCCQKIYLNGEELNDRTKRPTSHNKLTVTYTINTDTEVSTPE